MTMMITEKLFKHDGFFGDQNSDLTLEKANFPENLLTFVNQATISPLKNNQEAIYVVNVALAQLLPLVNSPPDIENYVCKDNELNSCTQCTILKLYNFWELKNGWQQ